MGEAGIVGEPELGIAFFEIIIDVISGEYWEDAAFLKKNLLA